jgi:cell division protein FtsI/penicillin-binding protein 2
MIGFAPASAPKVAIAVVVPYQPTSTQGATVAGPIVLKMLEAALG